MQWLRAQFAALIVNFSLTAQWSECALARQPAVAAIRPGSITQVWVGVIEPAGMILREDENRIVTNAGTVVPHFIEG